jgi:phosphocarrier protein HPr
MLKHSLTIQNKLGLHTRAAARLVDLTKRFASQVELTYRDRTVDSKSIMGVITLGAQKGDVVDVFVDGEDEADALQAIEKLVNDKFGED